MQADFKKIPPSYSLTPNALICLGENDGFALKMKDAFDASVIPVYAGLRQPYAPSIKPSLIANTFLLLLPLVRTMGR